MKISELIKKVETQTGFEILRPVDLELLKEIVMETEEFKDVIVFNVIHERDENIKRSLMNPKEDKFNSVVNIYSIHTLSGLDGNDVLMIDCYENTILSN